MNLLRATLALAALGLVGCDGTASQTDGGTMDGSPDVLLQCGVTGSPNCESTTPICYESADHNTGSIAGSRCETIPTGCGSPPACDCLVRSYTIDTDAGRRCPGLVYCDASDAGITVRCVPP